MISNAIGNQDLRAFDSINTSVVHFFYLHQRWLRGVERRGWDSEELLVVCGGVVWLSVWRTLGVLHFQLNKSNWGRVCVWDGRRSEFSQHY